MIVESDWDQPPVHSASPRAMLKAKMYGPRLLSFAVFFLLLATVVALQLASGAYHGEFGAYPDEPAHYVTSLMLRDYLIHFHAESPLRFAQDYYRHYPKVAFGHWPPLFYILQSAWMMLFSASRASIRLEMAVTTALLAYSVFQEAKRWFGVQAALLGGLLTVCLPLVQTYSDEEMAESLLTLLCFWTTIYFARYVEGQRRRDALLFAACFSGAVLTKGSGWLLAMIPPMVLVLSRKLFLLKRIWLWIPIGIISVACIPWQMMTMRLAERGWDGGSKPSITYTLNALLGFLGLFPKILGPLLLLFMAIGLFVLVLLPAIRRPISPQLAGLFGLLASVWIFHSVVPAGVEDRKLVLAVPAMVIFVLGGGMWVADQIPPGNRFYPWRYGAVGGVAAVCFLTTSFSVPRIQHYGFIEAARFLTTHKDLRDVKLLVSSESGGEGMLVSEVAMNEPRPSDEIVRATKALASVAWNGIDYHSTYTDASQVHNYLLRNGVQVVVLDTFAPQIHFAHNALLRQAIASDKHYVLVASFPSHDRGVSGEVQIYRYQN